jgi:predicted porin
MKKSLIALAAAGAFAAPAFAATSNVDVYGVLNVSIGSVDSDVTNDDRSTSVTSNASRIGFKGSEDLGGGLAAVWQIETGLNLDESGGTLASRNSFVGLKGGFGTVLFGRHDTPVKLLGRSVDNFGDTMADSRNLLGADGSNGASVYDMRPSNAIAYVSPSFSGLSFMGAYSTDHGVGNANNCVTGLDCNDRDAYSVSGSYNNGPLMLGAGYERQNTVLGGNDVDRSIWRIVGSFTMGDLKLGAQYENGSADNVAGLVGGDRDAWGIFGNYALGNIVLKANYLSVDDYKGVGSSGAKQYTLGADYGLSKRTTVYALYAKVKNDNNASFDLGVGAGDSDNTNAAGVFGNDPSVFAVGLKHSF